MVMAMMISLSVLITQDNNGDDSGSSYVVFGKASGFGASLDLSTLTGRNGFRLDGESQGDHSGVFSILGRRC